MNEQIIKLCRLLGDPTKNIHNVSDVSVKELKQLFPFALKNRMGLELLIRYEKFLDEDLKNELRKYKKREATTYKVLVRAAQLLDSNNVEHIIFKSIRPYAAIPNDTDIIIMEDKKEFKKIVQYFFDSGYILDEIAPLQTTVADPIGKEFIGPKKKGGTYYLDIYEDIGTDYFAYINKNLLKEYVITKVVNDYEVKCLRPEIELAILMFHNIFPERTFQLEHFYFPLFYLAQNPNFDIELFWDFSKKQSLTWAIITNFTIINALYELVFDEQPEGKLKDLFSFSKRNFYELKLFEKNNNLPYMFSFKTFWNVFFRKLKDPYALKSLGVQFVHMLSPFFFMDVIKALKLRFSKEGAYKQEL